MLLDLKMGEQCSWTFGEINYGSIVMWNQLLLMTFHRNKLTKAHRMKFGIDLLETLIIFCTLLWNMVCVYGTKIINSKFWFTPCIIFTITFYNYTPSLHYEILIEYMINMSNMSYFWHMCFEHKIFFHWYSGYNNAKNKVFLSCDVTNCKKKENKKNDMTLMKKLFLTWTLTFNVVALLFLGPIAIVTTSEHGYVMYYMGVIRSSFFPKNIVLG